MFLTILVVLLVQVVPNPSQEPIPVEDIALTAGALLIVQVPIATAVHEGSHALALIASGAEVKSVSIIPGFENGVLYFGLTRYVPNTPFTGGQTAFIALAPKLTDTVVLSLYGALLFTGVTADWSLAARIAVWTFAVASWVDFSKDLVRDSPTNDVSIAFRTWGFHAIEQQLVPRAVYGVAVGALLVPIVWEAVAIVQGSE